MGCADCPIKDTKFCHKIDPTQKKYTYFEKRKLAEKLKENKDNEIY